VRTLLALRVDHFVIDGEIVALDPGGRPSFQRLQPRMALTDPREIESAAARIPVEGAFFDCVELEGHDLRRLPLTQRKECLRMLVPPLGPVHYVDHVMEHGDAFLEAAAEARLEGIVAKRASSAYTGGRSRDWIKVKCQRRGEFVIGGYTDPQGARGYFGALHIGSYDGGVSDAVRLVYVSKVGTGFDHAGLKSLWENLQPRARATPPFDGGAVPKGRGHHWVEPRLVCEVRFSDWTNDGGIRHPTFLGLRSDKRPEDCRREESLPPSRNDAAEEIAVPAVPASPAGGESVAKEVKLTNLKKLFWPAEGYTKGDLVAYYEQVAPLLLPYLRDRPLVLTRYPDGITGKSFYQKDAPEFAPAWVRTERVYSKDAEREIDYFVVDDVESLRYVANSGAIPLHLWASRLGSLERPDWLVLDLDPKGAPFTDVVKVARALHRILDDLELPSYPKTSGATGLHILVPLGARYVDDEVRTFARLLAVLGVEAEPDISTVARPLRARGGKVYIDFGQNGHGQTIVAPFSLRPLPGAPASCPLLWSEVTARLDPARFTMATVPKRFDAMADPLLPVLGGGIDMAAALTRMAERFGGEAEGGVWTIRDSKTPGADARMRGRSRPPRA
jgi:bifunctional non-homologous end joining protein LigD